MHGRRRQLDEEMKDLLCRDGNPYELSVLVLRLLEKVLDKAELGL